MGEMKLSAIRSKVFAREEWVGIERGRVAMNAALPWLKRAISGQQSIPP